MKLTEHFLERELRVEAQIPEIQEIARWGCEFLLEPIRANFGPLIITSGYRDADRNKATGGTEKSFHLYPSSPSPKGAADFYAPEADRTHSPDRVVQLFDWIRLESKLPFDKVILEYDRAGVADVVHLQWYVVTAGAALPRPKSAWIGQTHGTGEYRSAQCNEAVVWPQTSGGAQCATA